MNHQMAYSEELLSTLKKARQKAALSQRALAAKIGVPQSHISKIENGHISPTISMVIEMARVLGLELMAVPKQYISAINHLTQEQNHMTQQAAYTLDDEE
jgi:ribosome-binding protein aMBF1 (putative translation factor)